MGKNACGERERERERGRDRRLLVEEGNAGGAEDRTERLTCDSAAARACKRAEKLAVFTFQSRHSIKVR